MTLAQVLVAAEGATLESARAARRSRRSPASSLTEYESRWASQLAGRRWQAAAGMKRPADRSVYLRVDTSRPAGGCAAGILRFLQAADVG